jgi:hypothetical protein
MDTETTEAENTLPEQEASTKPGRPPTTMTSTKNLIRLQGDFKNHVKGAYEFLNTVNEPVSKQKKWQTIQPCNPTWRKKLSSCQKRCYVWTMTARVQLQKKNIWS